MNSSKKISKKYTKDREHAIKSSKIHNSVYEVPCKFKPEVKLFIDSSPSIHVVN